MNPARRDLYLLIILYLGFVSLGLPDTVLGVAWPAMRLDFQASLAWAGALISLTTVISVFSSLAAGRLMTRFSAGPILCVCAFMTAGAMLGYARAPGLMTVVLLTGLFGLGQGAVDTAVNAYMSRHYSARQMNWVHGFWGLGATGGPLIFTAAFSLGQSWRTGYLAIFYLQISLALIFLLTLGLWKKPAREPGPAPESANHQPGLRAEGSPKRAGAGVAFYFLYPGLEVVTGLWGASYLIEVKGVGPPLASAALTLYWGSLTLGRFAVGLAAGRFGNPAIIRGALTLVALALIMATLASGPGGLIGALGLLGLGLAPLYPTMMHETPKRTGLEGLDKFISYQVGAALAGAAILPGLAGIVVRQAGLELLPKILMLMAVLLIAAWQISAGGREKSLADQAGFK